MKKLYNNSYEEFHKLTGKIAGQSISYFSKPGLSNWAEIPPSMSLLAQVAQCQSVDTVLMMGCGNGASSLVISQQIPNGYLYLMDISHIALECSRITLIENRVNNFSQVGYTLIPHFIDSIDKVLLDIPKGRQITRRWLIEAYRSLKTGGVLYLAGAKDMGIQSSIKDAESIFNNMSLLTYKKSNRIALFYKESETLQWPEWTQVPGIAPGTWVDFTINAREMNFQISSLPGIFSNDRLDEGTKLLLDTVEFPEQNRILDVGCGYGIIGMTAAVQAKNSWIDMVDVNLLAIAATQRNSSRNNIDNVRVFVSDLLEKVSENKYQLILSNPPFHTGKEVDYIVATSLFKQAEQVLEPGGKIIIVANKFIPYENLMKKTFNNVTTLAQTGKFIVLSSEK
jgi:16S rRNA (guanine1207-N2)-methyltransferase